MKDINSLIEAILDYDKIKSKFNESRIYSDEPILFTASKMQNYTPSAYREMREIAGTAYYRMVSAAEIFYKQAKFMENYEDDFDYHGEFSAYFPTYQSMNNMQLRGYFSWRTAVRRGDIKAVSLSFACVYLYELINQIGVHFPLDGYNKMKYFCDYYTQKDRRLIPYASAWLRDYVIYYGLDRSLLEKMPAFEDDDAMLALLEYKSRGASDVTSALCRLSHYNITESKFFKQYPEDTSRVVYNVYCRLADYFENKKGCNIFNSLFGSRFSCERNMFTSAVFFEEKPHADYEYEINALYKYICKNGRWSLDQCYSYRSKNELITAILKTVDSVMRLKYSYKYKLRPVAVPKKFSNIINEVIEEFLEEQRKAAMPKIEIDTSLLKNIRESSMVTQNKLIVDENELIELEEAQAEPEKPPRNDLLTETETELLAAVLNRKNYKTMLAEKHIMPSIIVDAINEKLFDIFGDTVLVLEGQAIIPTEEYKDELKGTVGL